MTWTLEQRSERKWAIVHDESGSEFYSSSLIGAENRCNTLNENFPDGIPEDISRFDKI